MIQFVNSITKSRYYKLDGERVVGCDNILEWGEWFENADRHVGKTHIGVWCVLVWIGRLFKIKRFEPIMVSTVFLGIDHGFGDGPPQLFETIIFGGEFDGEQWRYSTWAEAEKGHQTALDYIASGGDGDDDEDDDDI